MRIAHPPYDRAYVILFGSLSSKKARSTHAFESLSLGRLPYDPKRAAVHAHAQRRALTLIKDRREPPFFMHSTKFDQFLTNFLLSESCQILQKNIVYGCIFRIFCALSDSLDTL